MGEFASLLQLLTKFLGMVTGSGSHQMYSSPNCVF